MDLESLCHKEDQKNRIPLIRETERKLRKPWWIAKDLVEDLCDTVVHLKNAEEKELHLIGRGGMGKTHIISHTCHERLNSNLPAIFIAGVHFTNSEPINTQILNILDIPRSYSWHDFLLSLDSVGEAYNTKIPLIIDALNEATINGIFSSVWKNGLAGFVKEISELKNVALLTTTRDTYVDAIWLDNKPENMIQVEGFDSDILEEAIEKYFTWYKIRPNIQE